MKTKTNSNKNLTDSYLCYLTPQAKEVLEKLVDLGTDQDLAIATLEALWPETLIYDIPVEEKKE